MTAVKKYTSMLLLSVLFFGSGGYYLYFRCLQYEIQTKLRYEIRKGIDENRITLIVVPFNKTNEIVWIKKNKEFKYHGSLYDIVKTKTENGKIYFYCINDRKESKLIARFLRTDKQRKKVLRQLLKILSNKYLISENSIGTTGNVSDIIYSGYLKTYYVRAVDVPVPPPKLNFLHKTQL